MAGTTKVVLVMEYDGTRYFGFQWQSGLPSIQGELEAAVKRLTGEERRVMAASRTDAGVHAKGQVASFRSDSSLPVAAFVHGLNHYLPRDIAVKAAYRVGESFNVRRDAVSREYRYSIWNSRLRSPMVAAYSYLVAGPLDIGPAGEACRALVGVHDFASFASDDVTGIKSTVRRVFQADLARDGEMVTFNIVANSFLPHQVRNTVGALIRVGWGRMSVDQFKGIIEARKPGTAGPTVPARGLCLTRVNYPSPLGGGNENL